MSSHDVFPGNTPKPEPDGEKQLSPSEIKARIELLDGRIARNQAHIEKNGPSSSVQRTLDNFLQERKDLIAELAARTTGLEQVENPSSAIESDVRGIEPAPIANISGVNEAPVPSIQEKNANNEEKNQIERLLAQKRDIEDLLAKINAGATYITEDEQSSTMLLKLAADARTFMAKLESEDAAKAMGPRAVELLNVQRDIVSVLTDIESKLPAHMRGGVPSEAQSRTNHDASITPVVEPKVESIETTVAPNMQTEEVDPVTDEDIETLRGYKIELAETLREVNEGTIPHELTESEEWSARLLEILAEARREIAARKPRSEFDITDPKTAALLELLYDVEPILVELVAKLPKKVEGDQSESMQHPTTAPFEVQPRTKSVEPTVIPGEQTEGVDNGTDNEIKILRDYNKGLAELLQEANTANTNFFEDEERNNVLLEALAEARREIATRKPKNESEVVDPKTVALLAELHKSESILTELVSKLPPKAGNDWPESIQSAALPPSIDANRKQEAQMGKLTVEKVLALEPSIMDIYVATNQGSTEDATKSLKEMLKFLPDDAGPEKLIEAFFVYERIGLNPIAIQKYTGGPKPMWIDTVSSIEKLKSDLESLVTRYGYKLIWPNPTDRLNPIQHTLYADPGEEAIEIVPLISKLVRPGLETADGTRVICRATVEALPRYGNPKRLDTAERKA